MRSYSSVEIALVLTVGLVAAVGMPVLLCAALLRLPEDFVSREESATRRPAWRNLLRLLLGGATILLGVALLVLPGPGLLLIVVGLLASGTPASLRAARWVLARESVLREVNAFRVKRGRPPLHSSALRA